MNTKSKKKALRQKEAKVLNDDDISRTSLDLTVREKRKIGDLNDNYIYTRNNFIKPFMEAILRNIANHPDKKRLMKEIFQRV